MSLAGLYNLDPKDPASLMRWSFANMAEHFKIQRAIFDKHKLNLPLFPLDPIPLFDLVSWGVSHQAMHAGANAVLKLPGNDLTTVDFTKPEDIVVWVQLHASEH